MSLPFRFEITTEVVKEGPIPVWCVTHWTERFPWLVQGITGAGFDLRRFDVADVREAERRWERFFGHAGFSGGVLGRQVHGSVVAVHGELRSSGLFTLENVDGHLTDTGGLLLTVTVADCVPIYLVDEKRRCTGLLHGGWRGVAEGILDRGLELMADRFASIPEDLYVHFGPSVCGERYEVGPEVHEALGLEVPDGPVPVDLRHFLARRCVSAGVPESQISISSFSTLAEDSPFFSHRCGHAGRQVAFLGIRAD